MERTQIQRHKTTRWKSNQYFYPTETTRKNASEDLSNEMVCNFLQRALQEDPFWFWATDFNHKIKYEELCGMIINAIIRENRNKNNPVHTSFHQTDVLKN